MKKFLLNLSAVVALLVATIAPTIANGSEGQESKVIVGTYVSAQDGKIRVDGRDGNIYLLDRESIDSSIIIRNGIDQVYVLCSDGVKELKVGSTVVINVKGIVVVDVKN